MAAVQQSSLRCRTSTSARCAMDSTCRTAVPQLSGLKDKISGFQTFKSQEVVHYCGEYYTPPKRLRFLRWQPVAPRPRSTRG